MDDDAAIGPPVEMVPCSLKPRRMRFTLARDEVGGVCMNPAMALCQVIVDLISWSSVVPFAIAEMLGGVADAGEDSQKLSASESNIRPPS